MLSIYNNKLKDALINVIALFKNYLQIMITDIKQQDRKTRKPLAPHHPRKSQHGLFSGIENHLYIVFRLPNCKYL